MLEHLLEIVRVRSKHFDVDFGDGMLQNIPEDFLFLGREFKALHNLFLVASAPSDEFGSGAGLRLPTPGSHCKIAHVHVVRKRRLSPVRTDADWSMELIL
jgi:hypothetical protein